MSELIKKLQNKVFQNLVVVWWGEIENDQYDGIQLTVIGFILLWGLALGGRDPSILRSMLMAFVCGAEPWINQQLFLVYTIHNGWQRSQQRVSWSVLLLSEQHL